MQTLTELTPMTEFSSRTRIPTLLRHNSLKSVEDLSTVSEMDLRSIKGVGDTTIIVIKKRLEASYGFELLPNGIWRRDAIEVLYGSLDAAPLGLVLIEPFSGHLLKEAKIESLQDLLSKSADELRRMTPGFDSSFGRSMSRPIFGDKHVERIRMRLRQVALHLRNE